MQLQQASTDGMRKARDRRLRMGLRKVHRFAGHHGWRRGCRRRRLSRHKGHRPLVRRRGQPHQVHQTPNIALGKQVSNCNLRRRFLILSKSAAFDSVRFSTWKRQEGGWRVQGGRREEGETAPEEFVTPLLRLAETWPFFSWILARESA
jgi:hypothetical protein